MKKIVVVVGARPQFIKHAPVELALQRHFDVETIHTGQHYDEMMSKIFFEQLKIRMPKYELQVGSSSHGKQTGQMLEKIEDVLLIESPDAALVYGDTNSTLAGALAASKLSIPLIHIEAGLRSFNRSMPEEINRVVTDHVSDLLFSPTETATANLAREGIVKNVHYVGDVMQDSINLAKELIGCNYKQSEKVVVTIHRPYNTDSPPRLMRILEQLNSLNVQISFPTHPRTMNTLAAAGVTPTEYTNINFMAPASYFDMIKLILESSCVITDSGGVQKEAYMLERKCITLRSETEWIETLDGGWNSLIFENLHELPQAIARYPTDYREGIYGDGHAADKISDIVFEYFK